MRYKRRLNISSLGAAICNVAVFKGMKERQFRDEIHISYSEEGVLLEASSQYEWERANRFVENFLNNKKIALLSFGFQKEVYEELILRGLKDYTRRMKQHGDQCPYINIIHYQKLRKSCQYMDKEKYVEPLKDWERKTKKNPNFAFLIVQPISRFQEVKKNLLEYLFKKEVKLTQYEISCIEFILLFFNSSIKEEIKDNYEKKLIELSLDLTEDRREDDDQFKINIANYTNLRLDELDYQIVSYSKHLTRLGLQFISAKEIESQIKNVRMFLSGTSNNDKNESVSATSVFEDYHNKLKKMYGHDYCVIPFKKSQKQKYSAVINKFINSASQRTIEDLSQQIQKNIICSYDDIQFLNEINPIGQEDRGYKIHKACINECPFLLYQYERIPISQLQTFLMYIDQLKTYYCTYLVRFYGITIRYGNFVIKKGQVPAVMTLQQKIQEYTFFLIFDFHHRTVEQMVENDMIVDNFQIAQIILQLVYLINFLHSHQEPRALGSVRITQLYWPLKVVLPYLRSNDQAVKKEEVGQRGFFSSLGQGFQGDVKIAGQLMKFLLYRGQQPPTSINEMDDHFGDLLRSMLKQSKYERMALPKCLTTLEDLLLIN